MQTYRTSQIAQILGLHPNTIRLYETLEYIPRPERKLNGYRIFTAVHVDQIKLARLALKGEVLQNGMRKEAIKIIKTAAAGHYDEAIRLTKKYIQKISQEKDYAEDAIETVNELIVKPVSTDESQRMTRKQAADDLQVTIDTLRNWEMNGLLTVKRKENGYRIYDEDDRIRLKIIRSLRCANYSLAAILRMLDDLSNSMSTDIKHSINTPRETEDIVSVCDRLLTSLAAIERDAQQMLQQLECMQSKYKK